MEWPRLSPVKILHILQGLFPMIPTPESIPYLFFFPPSTKTSAPLPVHSPLTPTTFHFAGSRLCPGCLPTQEAMTLQRQGKVSAGSPTLLPPHHSRRGLAGPGCLDVGFQWAITAISRVANFLDWMWGDSRWGEAGPRVKDLGWASSQFGLPGPCQALCWILGILIFGNVSPGGWAVPQSPRGPPPTTLLRDKAVGRSAGKCGLLGVPSCTPTSPCTWFYLYLSFSNCNNDAASLVSGSWELLPGTLQCALYFQWECWQILQGLQPHPVCRCSIDKPRSPCPATSPKVNTGDVWVSPRSELHQRRNSWAQLVLPGGGLGDT